MFRTIKLFKFILFLTAILLAFSTANAQEKFGETTEKAKTGLFASNSADEKKQPEFITKRQDPTDKSSKTDYVRPDKKTRFNRYVKSIFGPTALAKTVAGAGFSTWRNSPEEWGDKWEGFGHRVASNMGKNAIKQTTIYALDEAFKLDSRFYRSEKRAVGSRLKNALISPITARNKTGKRVFGFPRVIGTYTASITAAEVWYPKRYGIKDGLKSGTISLGLNAAFNVVKEFFFK